MTETCYTILKVNVFGEKCYLSNQIVKGPICTEKFLCNHENKNKIQSTHASLAKNFQF